MAHSESPVESESLPGLSQISRLQGEGDVQGKLHAVNKQYLFKVRSQRKRGTYLKLNTKGWRALKDDRNLHLQGAVSR